MNKKVEFKALEANNNGARMINCCITENYGFDQRKA
jgi:hypothetical protein